MGQQQALLEELQRWGRLLSSDHLLGKRERSQLERADATSRRRGRRRKGTRKGREAAPLRRGEEHLELRACDGIVHIRAQIADGINASLSIELFLARKTKDFAAR